MIIRHIKPEEYKRFGEMCSICFEYPYDNDKTAQEIFEEASKNPSSREDLGWEYHYVAVEDDDRTMMSAFASIPFQVNFDGNVCDMRGIGGVVTLPQYRRRGAVRGCFDMALTEMYEMGADFSYLYPFSSYYYRKFGYETCCARKDLKIMLSFLPKTELSGGCELLESGCNHAEDVKKVYRDWQSRYNMMVIGDDRFEFAWLNKLNPTKTQEFSYIYISGDGTPKGYMSVRKVDQPDGRNLDCSRFVYSDAEGFYGLLSVLKALGSDHSFATIHVPETPDVTVLFPELRQAACVESKYFDGMVRVVNVESVLKKACYRGSGNVALKITDDKIEQNNGVFAVEFENGRAVSVKRNDKQMPAAELTIQAFSALITGIHDEYTMQIMPGVKFIAPADTLSCVFYKKPVMITEYF